MDEVWATWDLAMQKGRELLMYETDPEVLLAASSAIRRHSRLLSIELWARGYSLQLKRKGRI